MTLSREQLERGARDARFSVESYEKAHMLVRLLDAVRGHPFLGPRLALKGGSALNLFHLDMPRLSVDVDLNYLGTAHRAHMLADRPRVEQAIQQVAGRMGLAVRRVPAEHAGGKWRLSYATPFGRRGSLEIDVNFMFRTPLWPVVRRDSHCVAGDTAKKVLVLEEHELAAGKLAALVARGASRDLFDARELLRRPGLDQARLRLAFVVYGGVQRRDWSEVAVEQIRTTARDVSAQLVPMLRFDVRPPSSEIERWTEKLVRETRDLMAAVLPFSDREREFLERLNRAGEIVPELISDEPAMQAIIRDHPGLAWKALNVRKRLGLPLNGENT